ncbi:MAG: bifunctional 3-deoxy-7-phosphoheptulonate synthase/chorismate mutase type II [Alistipes sp.]|nr:bifunctional 3-deoxy-7-phosphoheptulonate synthase/chorismate mutase type II [Alistipes sp.]
MTDFEPIRFAGIADRRPLVIAGPCSAETEAQTLETARRLAAAGIRIFRAGLWKPRTKPGGFEGVGAEGIGWLQRVKRETGMYVTTEVATRSHVEAAVEGGIDLLWIGARTTANPFAMQELADALRGCDVPVLVKNPVSPDLELWIGAVERLRNAGIRRIGVIHRGFASIDRSRYRNHPMWAVPIELHRRFPGLQLFCDPSHIGGRRELIAPLAQQAMDLGFDGLFVEAHCTPDEAWSDKTQQITPQVLARLVENLVIRETATTTDCLDELRTQIDKLDDRLLELLAERMRVACEIGRCKKEHGMPVLQTRRYEELLARRTAQAAELGMDEKFMRGILQAIHEESIRQQMQTIDENQDGGDR